MIEYCVYEKTRYVRANLIGAENDLKKFVQNKVFDGGEVFDPHGYLNLTGSYIGKAKCHKQDEFSVEKGKQIAKSRALAKYYREKRKGLEKYYNWLSDKTDILKSEIELQKLYDSKRSVEKIKCPICGEEFAVDEEKTNAINAVIDALGCDAVAKYSCSSCGFVLFDDYGYTLKCFVDSNGNKVVYEVPAKVTFNNNEITIETSDKKNVFNMPNVCVGMKDDKLYISANIGTFYLTHI